MRSKRFGRRRSRSRRGFSTRKFFKRGGIRIN